MTARLAGSSVFPASPVKPPKGQRASAKDRFSPEGARLVAGVIVLSNKHSHPDEPVLGKYVLCISSSRHPNKVVLPKGGWEDHETVEEAALRECWEEAGVVAQVTRFLLQAKDPRPPKVPGLLSDSSTSSTGTGNGNSNSNGNDRYKGMDVIPGKAISRAEYRYFEVSPQQVCEDWPERDKRKRMWLTYDEAARVLADRKEMLCALQASSIVKS